jgi:hypothetical protein
MKTLDQVSSDYGKIMTKQEQANVIGGSTLVGTSTYVTVNTDIAECYDGVYTGKITDLADMPDIMASEEAAADE